MRGSHAKRNTAICEGFGQGRSIIDLGYTYGLGGQRIRQILQRGGVWRSRGRTGRRTFLGVLTDDDTKRRLRVEARAEGISVSALVQRKLKAMMVPEGEDAALDKEVADDHQ